MIVLGDHTSQKVRRSASVILIIVFFTTFFFGKYIERQVSIPIFVISLTRASERHNHLKKELRHLHYTIVDAVDGMNLTTLQSNLASTYSNPQGLLPGEIGCMLSHIVLWEKLLQDTIPYAIVLEDDAKVSGPILSIAAKISVLPHVDYALLGHCYEKKRATTVHRFYPYSIRKTVRAECTRGYYITRNGCRVLLELLHRDKCTQPIDDCIRDAYQSGTLSAVSVQPPVVTVENMKSTIDEKRTSLLDLQE